MVEAINKRAMAERERFTVKWLDGLKPAPKGEFYVFYDTGKPGLAVRVTDQIDKVRKGKAGSITFQFVGRFPGAKSSTKRTIGRYPKITLGEAHGVIDGWFENIAIGVDPKQAAQEAAEAVAKEAAAKRERAFENVLSEFIAARKRDGVVKYKEDERDFNRECSTWKGRAVEDISMGDILAVLESIEKRGKKRQALNMGQKIGTFFNYCVDVELLDVSPYRPKRVSKVIGTKIMRERVLTPVEISAFWKATATLKAPVRDAYRVLLLTGARLNEVAKMQWSEVDFDRERIVLEKARTKQGRDHAIPVTAMVREILDSHRGDGKRPWVFLTEFQNALTVNNKDKLALDKAMLTELQKEDSKAVLLDWVNHDLRRTVQTGMGDLEISDDVIHAVVGHKTDKLTQTYNKSERMPEKRAALEKWQSRLREIIGLPPLEVPDNIIKFSATA